MAIPYANSGLIVDPGERSVSKAWLFWLPSKFRPPINPKTAPVRFVHQDIPNFYKTRPIIQDASKIRYRGLHRIVNRFVDRGLDGVATFAQFALS